jgi:predicted amidohydrolase
LSLTGYEPALSKQLAINHDDSRLDVFQTISDTRNITIGVGAPMANDGGVSISMILFKPQNAKQVYSKKYLHADEEEFFISGENLTCLTGAESNIALAICYELSVPEHAANAFKSGAEIYIASVAKTAAGIEKAVKTLADIAHKYSMTVLMSNCIGECDGHECGGKTSAWDNKGQLTRQLSGTSEGIIIIDTATREVIEKYI